MILVTGATGTVGSEVVKQLVEKGEKLRILTRDPKKASKFGNKVEVAKGDFADAKSLDAALKGADRAFLLSGGPTLERDESNFVDAAKRAGVKRIVKLSVMGADQPNSGPLTGAHRRGEQKLEASGIAWTHVRPGSFMTNSFQWAETIKKEGKVYLPTGNGKLAVIDPRDIAAVAVSALTSNGHEGKAYTLTGPEAMTTQDQAAKISAAIGKPVNHVDIPREAAKKNMIGMGMPEQFAEALLGFYDAVRAGYTSAVSPDVEKVLGRKGRTFEAWAKENAAAFK